MTVEERALGVSEMGMSLERFVVFDATKPLVSPVTASSSANADKL